MKLGAKTTMSNEHKRLSKFISLVLRHKPEKIGITLDEFGYADINDLINGINASGGTIDLDILQTIVKDDKKGRYSFNETMTKIRANQGHSIEVKVSLREIAPQEYLYHGTAIQSLADIKLNGIKKMNRLYVHLSENEETALQVGKRHGEPIILKIDSQRMYEDGYKFYLSENHVWLAEFVPTEYITNDKQ